VKLNATIQLISRMGNNVHIRFSRLRKLEPRGIGDRNGENRLLVVGVVDVLSRWSSC
jgi:hypothetical protein